MGIARFGTTDEPAGDRRADRTEQQANRCGSDCKKRARPERSSAALFGRRAEARRLLGLGQEPLGEVHPLLQLQHASLQRIHIGQTAV
jgi:hypothetical protein